MNRIDSFYEMWSVVVEVIFLYNPIFSKLESENGIQLYVKVDIDRRLNLTTI